MIALPSGVTINYDVAIVIDDLSDEILAWFRDAGGKTTETGWYDSKGRQHIIPVVQFGVAKPSHKMQDGTGNFIIRFKSQDATTALMFLMKYDTHVVSHNMKEYQNYVY